MGAKQKQWARKVTKDLREKLGGRCVVCGTVDELEFDCIRPMGHEHHKMEWSWRMSFYRRQFAAGNLQLMCKFHNGEKGNDEKNSERNSHAMDMAEENAIRQDGPAFNCAGIE